MIASFIIGYSHSKYRIQTGQFIRGQLTILGTMIELIDFCFGDDPIVVSLGKGFMDQGFILRTGQQSLIRIDGYDARHVAILSLSPFSTVPLSVIEKKCC